MPDQRRQCNAPEESIAPRPRSRSEASPSAGPSTDQASVPRLQLVNGLMEILCAPAYLFGLPAIPWLTFLSFRDPYISLTDLGRRSHSDTVERALIIFLVGRELRHRGHSPASEKQQHQHPLVAEIGYEHYPESLHANLRGPT